MTLRSKIALLLALVLLASALPASRGAGAAAYIEPRLQATLATASPTSLLEAVANYDPLVTTGASLSAAIQGLGAGTITFRNLDSVALIGTPAQVTQVATLPGVTGLYLNTTLEYHLRESVPFIGADRAWSELGVTGKGIGVAVIDTGIDASHPDLAWGSKTVQNVKVLGGSTGVYSFRTGTPEPLYLENQTVTDTSSGHGTHVAGIVAGNGAASGGYYTGVAKEAHLVGVSVGEVVAITWALAGIDYVLEHARQYNIKVVNNSWGEKKSAAEYDPDHPVNQATRKLYKRGITTVFSAGNSGPSPDTMNHYAMPPWVISVAAGCKPGDPLFCPDGELASFSARGVPGSDQFHPTLTAPGANIVSARAVTGVANVNNLPFDALFCNLQYPERYTCGTGTSMAAPHVAGTVALMQQAGGGKLKPDRIKDILTRTARPMYRNGGTPYALYEVGAGYLDAYAAVRAVRGSR